MTTPPETRTARRSDGRPGRRRSVVTAAVIATVLATTGGVGFYRLAVADTTRPTPIRADPSPIAATTEAHPPPGVTTLPKVAPVAAVEQTLRVRELRAAPRTVRLQVRVSVPAQPVLVITNASGKTVVERRLQMTAEKPGVVRVRGLGYGSFRWVVKVRGAEPVAGRVRFNRPAPAPAPPVTASEESSSSSGSDTGTGSGSGSGSGNGGGGKPGAPKGDPPAPNPIGG